MSAEVCESCGDAPADGRYVRGFGPLCDLCAHLYERVVAGPCWNCGKDHAGSECP